MTTPELTDEHLMAALAKGDQSALTALMRRYQKDIFRFCLHYLKNMERAEDLTQETFVRVYTASGRFDESRKFRPWVLCIARNLCLNELKRRRTVPMESLDQRIEQAPGEAGDLMRSDGEAPDETVMLGERYALLALALDSLNEEAREIVTLRFFERMSARDIADIVGSTEGAIRTKLHRILAGLRKNYEESRHDL